MLSGPTALVIGAGASADFKLPVGSQLADDIVGRLRFYFRAGRLESGDAIIAQRLQDLGREDSQQYFVAARSIADGLPGFKSIDDFLYTHSSNERAIAVGKMAIVSAIAHYERKSTLRPLWSHDPDERQAGLAALRSSWIHPLVQTLMTGVRREDRQALFEHLTVVNFNYDRCLETALYHAIQGPLGIDGLEAAEVLSRLKVYHPYGSLGPLPVQAGDGLPFGPDSLEAVRVSERIRVYTEDMEHTAELTELRERLGRAQQIIFLGFGFHRQNMELLDIGLAKNMGGRQVLATAYREPQPAREVFERRVREALGPSLAPRLTDADANCAAVMNNHLIAFSR